MPCVVFALLFAIEDKFLLLTLCRGIKATRDHGYVVHPYSLKLWGEKRLEMREIPGIVFAWSSQTQREVHCYKMVKENVQGGSFFLWCKSPYLLGLTQTGSCSISIIGSDSLQPSTVRAFNHFQPCGLTSAASKWWWCECFSVPDRLWNELLSPISTLQLTHPSFFSNKVIKKWACPWGEQRREQQRGFVYENGSPACLFLTFSSSWVWGGGLASKSW